MNKAELVEAIASDAKLTKADAGRALDAFTNNVTKALKKGKQINTIYSVHTPAMAAINSASPRKRDTNDLR